MKINNGLSNVPINTYLLLWFSTLFKGVNMPKLFITDVESDADLKVYVADIRGEAHLAVYETTSQWEATEPQIWAYSDIRSDAYKVIFFTDGAWNADLVIFKTDIQSDAGWLDSSREGVL